MRYVLEVAGHVRVASLLLTALIIAGCLTAQADICVRVDTSDYVLRASDNSVEAHVGSSLSGACMYDWYPGVEGWLYASNEEIDNSGGTSWGGYGGYVDYSFNPAALSQHGPGTYTALGLHSACCPSCNGEEGECDPPYQDQWDGYDWGDLLVQQPTITGFGSGGAMWYLGPGTASQVLAQDNNYYYQAYTLQFNANCNEGEPCGETPQWTISTDEGVPTQATLSSSSGQSVTISSGPNTGNCQWSTHVRASIAGFQTPEYPFAVNSPTHVVDPTWEVQRATQQWGGGYMSQVYWAVADACQPAPGALVGLPLYETFGAFTNGQGVNWPDPSATSSPVFNYQYSDYVFRDSIGADSATYTPVPTYTSSQPPFTYNTLLKSAPQTWSVGSMTLGNGTQVYSGTIKYYQDHGTSE